MPPSRSFSDLTEIIAKLRDPEGGCPWDRAQDHRSLRPYLLEETYEALAAIDDGDADALLDELGDVLLQVLLHSQIASERGTFSIDDVIERLAEKLVYRHPHVFSEASGDLDAVVKRWDDLKRAENRKPSVPPPLVAARKAAGRIDDRDRITALADSGDDDVRIGARILVEIHDGWEKGVDPELALRRAIDALDES